MPPQNPVQLILVDLPYLARFSALDRGGIGVSTSQAGPSDRLSPAYGHLGTWNIYTNLDSHVSFLS